ncbi:MAG: hypothetical protein EPO21_24715 [Chloroflexota bacterium]|nr:MAG: hypothetical protein EPO21_24715 [Chloroflexota bacterium]
MDTTAIPQELIERPQWVGWVYNKERRKIPLGAKTGRAASSTDPATWADFSTVYRFVQADKRRGLGYVLSEQDPYVGVDFDHCRDPKTGAIDAAAWQDIEALGSYSEVSPSGTGVKVICRAKLDRAYKGPKIELYKTGRFFTITGLHVQGTPEEVNEAQAEIHELIRRHFPNANGTNGHNRASVIGETIAKGEQHNTLVSLAGSMRYRGFGEEEIKAALMVTNAKRLEEPAPPEHIEKIAQSICTLYEPGATPAKPVNAKSANTPTPLAEGRDGSLGDSVGSLGQPDRLPYHLVCLADVEPEEVEWLWRGYIPFGKITAGDGDPGLGKSTMLLNIAARVTTGRPMPDGSCSDIGRPAGVLLLTAEDDPADTIRPRLDAAGADVSKVSILQYVTTCDEEGNEHERFPTIPDHLHIIERAIEAIDARLVIIDPIMAYLSTDVNAHHDQDVRQALAPLAAIAERTGAAVVIIRHLNKTNGSNPLYRGGGSIGIIGAARSGLLVAKDPDDLTGKRRILASSKCNLAEEPVSLIYHLESADNGVVRIVWDGLSAHTAGTLLAQPTSSEEGEAVTEAKEVLRGILRSGPRLTKEVTKEAKAAGVSERTLWRAKTALGVKARKRSFDGAWQWELPAAEPQAEEQDNPSLPTESPRLPSLPSAKGVGVLADFDGRDGIVAEVLLLAERMGWPSRYIGRGIHPSGSGWETWTDTASPDELAVALRDLGGEVHA